VTGKKHRDQIKTYAAKRKRDRMMNLKMYPSDFIVRQSKSTFVASIDSM